MIDYSVTYKQTETNRQMCITPPNSLAIDGTIQNVFQLIDKILVLHAGAR